jgi:pimeloyl-ACP methyl ester carboxylesterase
MRLSVNGTTLWFDVDGAQLVPSEGRMIGRPVVILLHGGPGSYDHSYFKPEFSCLTSVAQVIYLDLRDHGRSAWGDPNELSFETCADDIRAFCDALEIASPILFGHSLGGYIATTYAAKYPDHPRALVLASTAGRFVLARIVAAMRAYGGDAAAEEALRFYSGDCSRLDQFRALVRPLFGRWIPGDQERSRILANAGLLEVGLARMRSFDVLERLAPVSCPTLVLLGDRDPIAQPQDAEDLVRALSSSDVQVCTIPGAGHFPWKEEPDTYWSGLLDFIASV